ncbi:hypothetical protein [Ponticaulis profundi]|uniref:Sulfotransferase domain-containing protein n=1 Tax=Ponticaulis profundi TaxID=2665222 RepID=A0ABW1S8Y3_9PROT
MIFNLFGSKSRTRVRKITLHIGYEKCGSKSIQRFLHSNRTRLSEQGFETTDVTKVSTYDLALMAYAGMPGFRDIFSNRTGKNFSTDGALRQSIDASLRKAFASEPEAHWLFSFEGLLHVPPAGIVRLRKLLTTFCDEISIVCFVRRQDRQAISGYTTRLRNDGLTLRSPLANIDGGPVGIDYFACLENWRAAFGREALSVYAFEDNTDVVEVIADHLGLDTDGLTFPERENTSLSAHSQEILRSFNDLHNNQADFQDHLPELRAKLRAILPKGLGRLPTRAEVHAYLTRFETGNEDLRGTYLPEGSAFYRELLDYPETEQIERVSREEVDAWVQKAALAAGIELAPR